MTKYVKNIKANNAVEYRNLTTGQAEPVENISPSILEELQLADEGTVIDSETVTSDASTVTTPSGDPAATAKPQAPVVAAVEEAEEEEEEYAGPFEAPAHKEHKRVKMDDGKEAPVSKNPFRQASPTSEKGFGYPRRNGKTVDIFDLKTPHTELRAIEGKLVPLSAENYRTRTDAEIYDRLVELGLIEVA